MRASCVNCTSVYEYHLLLTGKVRTQNKLKTKEVSNKVCQTDNQALKFYKTHSVLGLICVGIKSAGAVDGPGVDGRPGATARCFLGDCRRRARDWRCASISSPRATLFADECCG